MIADFARQMTMGFKAEGEHIWLIGGDCDYLGQSLWPRECHGRKDGPTPPVDLGHERRAGHFVAQWVASGDVTAVHDVSDGGPLVAFAEMALAGGIGAVLVAPALATVAAAFGENQGRYIAHEETWQRCRGPGIDAAGIGTTGGMLVGIVALDPLCAAHEDALPAILAGTLRLVPSGGTAWFDKQPRLRYGVKPRSGTGRNS